MLFVLPLPVSAQSGLLDVFSHQDSLRGFLNKYRADYDVKYYDLEVKVNITEKSISGNNNILFQATSDLNKIQVDLFQNMIIDSILFHMDHLQYQRDGNAFFITFPQTVKKNEIQNIRIYYHGKPVVSDRPPWDGGFVWEKDSLGRDWIGVACEGTGASLWWPNKDHLSDEPDSMRISVITPAELDAICNGQFVNRQPVKNGFEKWTWKITYPINNYNVTLNLGHFAHFFDYYKSEDGGSLSLNYYVLDYDLDKARIHFQQVKKMLACYEYYLGKFPFWRDGYKLVETPYWGMEHQSCIAYGNDFKNNDFGFDFIIVHESAHEYWGNSVTAMDHGELWIHESFATYMESLYVEYYQGKERAWEYLDGQKQMIYNIRPIKGPLDVNYNGWIDADMYYKGAWMLHSIRNTIDDDSKWFDLLKMTYQHFAMENIYGRDLIYYMNEHTDYNIKPLFNQYLTTTKVPTLDVKMKNIIKGIRLKYKWTQVVNDFNMPVKVRVGNGNYQTLYPDRKRKSFVLNTNTREDIKFSTELFYFKTKIRK